MALLLLPQAGKTVVNRFSDVKINRNTAVRREGANAAHCVTDQRFRFRRAFRSVFQDARKNFLKFSETQPRTFLIPGAQAVRNNKLKNKTHRALVYLFTELGKHDRIGKRFLLKFPGRGYI